MKINKDFIVKYFEKGAKKLSDCGIELNMKNFYFLIIINVLIMKQY